MAPRSGHPRSASLFRIPPWWPHQASACAVATSRRRLNSLSRSCLGCSLAPSFAFTSASLLPAKASHGTPAALALAHEMCDGNHVTVRNPGPRSSSNCQIRLHRS
eukprot:6219816-Pyramimonas_sp.AAC.1